MENPLLYTMALGFTRGIGPITAKALVDHFGDANQLYTQLADNKVRLEGFGKKIIERILDERQNAFKSAEREISELKAAGVTPLGHWADSFPKRLWKCVDSPLVVYLRGKPLHNAKRTVCLLGSKVSSQYGERLLEYLLKGLKNYGITIISGYFTAWDHKVVTVCEKLQVPYMVALSGEHLGRQSVPDSHGGSILSVPPILGTRTAQRPFTCDRLLAGLADLCIVIEAEKQDSAISVAEMANEYGRDVAAFPGSVWSRSSFGSNFLIKTHKATLISRLSDLKYVNGWEPEK